MLYRVGATILCEGSSREIALRQVAGRYPFELGGALGGVRTIGEGYTRGMVHCA